MNRNWWAIVISNQHVPLASADLRFERNLQARFVFSIHIYPINQSVGDVAFTNAFVAYLGYRERNSAGEYRFVTFDAQRPQGQIRCAKIESESRCARSLVARFDCDRDRFR